MGELQQEIVEIIARVAEIPPDQIAADASLKDLGIDSLGALSVVAAVEARYGIQVREEDIADIRTLADVTALTLRYTPGLGQE